MIGRVNDVPSPELRIGDADRESALSALGEHMAAGRLDIEEYGERSAKVTAAKTRGELAEVFTDLPGPHPAFGTAPAPVPGPPPTPGATVEPARKTQLSYGERPLAQRLTAGLMPLALVAAFALFFSIGGWWWFALPFIVGAVGQGLWGKEWDKDHPHDRRPDRRRDRDRWRDERDRRRDDRDWRRS